MLADKSPAGISHKRRSDEPCSSRKLTEQRIDQTTFIIALMDCRQIIDVLADIKAHIVGGDMDVADVAQEPASGPAHKLRKKFNLTHRGRAETHVARRVLNEVCPAQPVLDFMDAPHDEFQRHRIVWRDTAVSR